MQQQLREIVEHSVATLHRFFMGFLTLEQIKQAVGGKPLRLIRPLVSPEEDVELIKKKEVKKKLTRAEQ